MMLSYIKLGIILTLTQESISRNPFKKKTTPSILPTTHHTTASHTTSSTPATPLKQVKRPYQQGINCNVETFQSVTHRVFNRYFCVLRSECLDSAHRIPVIPFDLCNDYYDGVGDDDLVCCHQSDMKEKPNTNWTDSFLFVPSFRSYVMCRHYSHLLCAGDGSSYCERSTLQLKSSISTVGIPQIIDRYPHTAIIGYLKDPSNLTYKWFCVGSIISERVIITSKICQHDRDADKKSTHVKVGESIICEHCTDRPGEQTFPISRWEIHNITSDIAFIFLSQDIHFNQQVRPGCFLHQPFSPARGSHVHYGKPAKTVKTGKTIWPVFHIPANKTFITFKVKTSQNAVIHLSETGGPRETGNYWEVYIGKLEQGLLRVSGIRRGGNTSISLPIFNSLHEDQFRGFWIKLENDGTLSFGEEDKTEATMSLKDPSCCFNISVIGLSTPNSTGEWIFSDHIGLFSLHGHEMKVLWGERCASYHPEFETLAKYFTRTNDKNYIGEAEFCAGDEYNGKAPCDNDWGSTIQVMDKFNMPCMWKMFGMYSQDKKRSCSSVLSPGVFINFANYLASLEDIAYPSFSKDWFNLKITQPSCLLPTFNHSDPGRCPAFLVPF